MLKHFSYLRKIVKAQQETTVILYNAKRKTNNQLDSNYIYFQNNKK